MSSDMLERILRFTVEMNEQGRMVYLGASGVPFTAEGCLDGLDGMEVDLGAINEELARRDGAGG